MRQTKRTLVILGLALASCRGPITLPATLTPQTVSVRIMATTATAPLLNEFVTGYEVPGTLLVVDRTVANWQTIQARLAAGDVPYALTTYVSPDGAWWIAPVGYDGIVVIVHPTTVVPVLTLTDLQLVMSGQLVDWAAVGGTAGPVTVVSREAGSATRLAFEAQVMAGETPALQARLALSSAQMVDLVANTPGAIGYVSMGWLGDAAGRVAVVPLSPAPGAPGVVPSPAAVSDGSYPLRTGVMIAGTAPPEPNSVFWQWFTWMQSDAGQAVVTRRFSGLSRQ